MIWSLHVMSSERHYWLTRPEGWSHCFVVRNSWNNSRIESKLVGQEPSNTQLKWMVKQIKSGPLTNYVLMVVLVIYSQNWDLTLCMRVAPCPRRQQHIQYKEASSSIEVKLVLASGCKYYSVNARWPWRMTLIIICTSHSLIIFHPSSSYSWCR